MWPFLALVVRVPVIDPLLLVTQPDTRLTRRPVHYNNMRWKHQENLKISRTQLSITLELSWLIFWSKISSFTKSFFDSATAYKLMSGTCEGHHCVTSWAKNSVNNEFSAYPVLCEIRTCSLRSIKACRVRRGFPLKRFHSISRRLNSLTERATRKQQELIDQTLLRRRKKKTILYTGIQKSWLMYFFSQPTL